MPSDFGDRLRRHRESLGLTLEAVAESTKIKASLLADLERNDVSRWPTGIYGRGFLRAYADAIGISPGLLLDQLFGTTESPDANGSSGTAITTHAEDAMLRLTLAASPAKRKLAAAQVADATIVLAAVLALSGLIATAAGVAFLTATAVVALVWYPATHALFGTVAPIRCLRDLRKRSTRNVPSAALPSVASTNTDAELLLVREQPLQLSMAGGGSNECAAESGVRRRRARIGAKQVSQAPGQTTARLTSNPTLPRTRRQAIIDAAANSGSDARYRALRTRTTKPN